MKCLMLTALIGMVVLTGCAADGTQSQSGQSVQSVQSGSREDAPMGSLMRRRPSTNSSDISDSERLRALAVNDAKPSLNPQG